MSYKGYNEEMLGMDMESLDGSLAFVTCLIYQHVLLPSHKATSARFRNLHSHDATSPGFRNLFHFGSFFTNLPIKTTRI